MEESPSNDFKFRDTTATQRVFGLDKRIRAVAGGTSASKTISILVWLIDYCQTRRNKLVSVVSESFPHLLGGAIRDFENIMRDRGYWREDSWVRNPRAVYTFETGCQIEFYSPDTYGKAHGPRRDVLFINEANNVEYRIADQLITRTAETVWMDWNPTNEFWFYSEMLHKRDDIDFITLTYKDNEGLPASVISEIESHRNNKSWWNVYGLGQLGEVEGKIYKGWQIIDELPHEARLERYALDFGYSNDPTAIIGIYSYNGGYILDEVAFQKGLLNKQIADIILSQPVKALTIADSSEPKSIDEIRGFGPSIVGAEKGPDSVRNGIAVVQDQRISITKRSVNVIKEYRNYLWMTDKNGAILNEPEHQFSHSMDAIRYGLTSLVKLGSMKQDTYEQAPLTPGEYEGGASPIQAVRQHKMMNVFNQFKDEQDQYSRGEFE